MLRLCDTKTHSHPSVHKNVVCRNMLVGSWTPVKSRVRSDLWPMRWVKGHGHQIP